MRSFVSKSRERGVTYIFDIGSRSIAAALVRSEESGVVRIVRQHRTRVAHRPDADRVSVRKKYIEMLADAARGILQHGEDSPMVAVFLSSRWHIVKSRTARLVLPEPTVITEKLLSSAIDADIARLERELPQDIPEYLIIEREIMLSRLNGYEVEHPVGMRAREIELDYFVSVADSRFVHEIEQCIRVALGVDVDCFYSSLGALYRAMVAESETGDFTVIRASSGATDAFLVRDGALIASGTIAAGIERILCDVGEAVRLDPAHVRSLIALVGSPEGGAGAIERIRKPLETASGVYAGLLYGQLSGLAETALLPATAYIFCDPAYLPLFEVMLGVQEFTQLTLTGTPFDVRGPAHKYIPALAKIATGDHPDLFLALEASSLSLLEKPLRMI